MRLIALAATARLAAYDADEFATGSRKFWLQLEWACQAEGDPHGP